MRHAIIALMATAITASASGLYVVRDGAFTGLRYAENRAAYRAHHAHYGEDALWIAEDASITNGQPLTAAQVAELANPVTPEQLDRAIKAAARMAVDLDAATAEDVAVLAPLYDAWQSGQAVEMGDVRRYDAGLYRCLQAHATQSDWTPAATPALWVRIAPPDAGPQPWAQPAGAHDSYQTGDRVTHEGATWESTIDANVWEPGVYGWVEV